MEYLTIPCPYLFGLAMGKNPFDQSASVVFGRTAEPESFFLFQVLQTMPAPG
jgi:hypothetical protein